MPRDVVKSSAPHAHQELAPLAYRPTGPCWVCTGTDGERVHQAILEFDAWREQDPELSAYTGETIWLWKCASCGFAQPERIPALPRYFERMYDQRWSPEWVVQEFESTYKDLIFQRFLGALNDRVPPASRALLDIGSHAGRFLHLARHAGWQAEGTEINPRTAAYAAERTGAPVHRLKAEQVLGAREPIRCGHADRRARAHSRTGHAVDDRSARRSRGTDG